MQLPEKYYAVIFTSIRTDVDGGYSDMAADMEKLASQQDGFVGIESARSELGITVSYWKNLEAIQQWKKQSDHILAQRYGREKWYSYYKVRICSVEREYEFGEGKP